jgi:hypothetical protein
MTAVMSSVVVLLFLQSLLRKISNPSFLCGYHISMENVALHMGVDNDVLSGMLP